MTDGVRRYTTLRPRMGYSGCGRYVRFTDYENLQSECDRLKEELEDKDDCWDGEHILKEQWKSIADRLAEAVGHTSIGCCECCRKEPCKACQRVLDLVSEHKAIKSYNAVKGE